MTHTSKTILFFGTEDFSATTLEELIRKNYSIGAIITKPDTRRGRSKELVPPQVKLLGEAHGIPVWQPRKLSHIAGDISAFDNPVGVLVSYGKIIPQSIIDLFSPGIINLHPSLLPKYRGPSPIETAVLNGDSETGISIMQLSAAMDAGPVHLKETIPLQGNETAPELYESLGARGAELLASCLPQILDGTLPAVPQDSDSASYCALITKEDGQIDWQRQTAEQIERKVRAYSDWPQCRAAIGGIEVIITATHLVASENGAPGTLSVLRNEETPSLVVATQKASLSIDRLKPIGKKEMPIGAFLAGYSNKLGL